MIIPMLCVTIFVILVVWLLLLGGVRLMIYSATTICIFVCCVWVKFIAVLMILCVALFIPRSAMLMMHTPTSIIIFVCLIMVQLMAFFISMRCTLCGHFLQVALTLILVVGYAIAAS